MDELAGLPEDANFKLGMLVGGRWAANMPWWSSSCRWDSVACVQCPDVAQRSLAMLVKAESKT